PSSAAATASTAPAAAVTQPSPPAAPVRRARPWYRRWWVWTLIGGAVAAAAGVSIGVAAANSGDTPPGFDLRLRFPGR
ncbi:MAG: hypothetical protein KC503_35180, partial [Myxococcales bacterium]|nr:hypothetical protein [Myxococcales bacterium]